MTGNALESYRHSLFVAGRWTTAHGGERLVVEDPSIGRAFAFIDAAGPDDVARAVTAACESFPAWRRTAATTRGSLLRAIGRGLEGRRETLVELLMRNNGKPRAEAQVDVSDAVATFDYYAELAAAMDHRQDAPVHLPDPHYRGATRLEPLGPVGMIVPWNFPLVTSAWKIAPALAAGCTVVIKTSEYTPLIERVYGDICVEAGVPAGVFNLLTGAAATGTALTADPRLAKLSFTGSNAVGARVMAAAARRCLPVSLELGGKSPIVVFADADPDHAVDCIIAGIFFNCGQMCSATSRLILDRRAADSVLDRLAERCRSLRVGSPFEPDTAMGPQTTRAQYEKVCGILARARADGLSCLAGGTAAGDRGGFFVSPTIFAEVPTDHMLWREEVFGPVLAVRLFDSEDEAFALANDSDFALVATVVTADRDRARRATTAIDAGHFWVNAPQVIFPQSAWGGFRSSGIGRELGPWGLSAYQGVKHITAAVGQP